MSLGSEPRQTDQLIDLRGSQLMTKFINVEASASTTHTLVFLHDALGSIDSWGDFPIKMCTAYQMDGFLFDRIGNGKSSVAQEPKGTNYLEIEATQILPHLLDEMGIDRPIFIGASDGATIALIYASLYPSIAVLSLAGHILVEEATILGVNETYSKLNSAYYIDLLQNLHGEKAVGLLLAWASLWLSEEFRSWNIEHMMPTIECPVLILQGERDQYATKFQAKLIADSIGKNADYRFIRNCEHLLHVTHADEIIEMFKHYLP